MAWILAICVFVVAFWLGGTIGAIITIALAVMAQIGLNAFARWSFNPNDVPDAEQRARNSID